MRAINLLCFRAAEIWGVTVLALKGGRQCKAMAWPRQAVMYVATKELGISTTLVGRYLGNRDHTTVLHGCKAVTARIEKDAQYRAQVKALVSYAREIPESVIHPSARGPGDPRCALDMAAADAVEQLLDLSASDPDAFRALLVDVMRGRLLKKQIEARAA